MKHVALNVQGKEIESGTHLASLVITIATLLIDKFSVLTVLSVFSVANVFDFN